MLTCAWCLLGGLSALQSPPKLGAALGDPSTPWQVSARSRKEIRETRSCWALCLGPSRVSSPGLKRSLSSFLGTSHGEALMGFYV